jgi:hypothetical protein
MIGFLRGRIRCHFRCRNRSENRFKQLEKIAHLRLGNDERRQEAKSEIVRTIHQQPAIGRFRDKRRAFDRKFNADDQAFAAHFAYEIKLLAERGKSLAQFSTPRANIFEQLFALNDIQKFKRRRANERTAVEPCNPGLIFAATASEARIAPSGNPAASGFAITTMSGFDENF